MSQDNSPQPQQQQAVAPSLERTLHSSRETLRAAQEVLAKTAPLVDRQRPRQR